MKNINDTNREAVCIDSSNQIERFGDSLNHFNESLILAQDERWRRA